MERTINFTLNKMMRLWLLLALVVGGSCNSDDETDAVGASGVHMKTLPKVAYVLGEELDLSDMVLTLERDGGVVDIPF